MGKNLYLEGFKAGKDYQFKSTVEMVLKCVVLTLYSSDWPKEAMEEARDKITDAILYYGDHTDEMNELIKEFEEETGVIIRFNKEEINAKKKEEDKNGIKD